MHITLEQARSIALHQNLHRFRNHSGKPGVLNVINQISYVQIDTISVIERAHHHTLYNRIKDYHPSMLDELFSSDKALWEYWGHAASYLPLEDYAYYTFRMQTFPNGSWEAKFWNEHKHLEQPILERIRTDGALSARHFEDTRPERQPSGWGDWKPAKLMLELLTWKGDLMVTGRDKFQRIYDLTERVLPHYKSIDTPSETERVRFMIRRSLMSHGIVSENDIKNHLFLASKAAIHPVIKQMVSSGEILPVQIDGITTPYYMLAETSEELLNAKPVPKRVYLLSPFDNAVIMRPRLKQLFGFDYTIECYLLKTKRVYGYWSMPVLWQNNFIGRIDPKADRKTKTLIINSLYIEKPVWKSPTFQKELEKELTAFAIFNGCDKYTLDNIIFL